MGLAVAPSSIAAAKAAAKNFIATNESKRKKKKLKEANEVV